MSQLCLCPTLRLGLHPTASARKPYEAGQNWTNRDHRYVLNISNTLILTGKTVAFDTNKGVKYWQLKILQHSLRVSYSFLTSGTTSWLRGNFVKDRSLTDKSGVITELSNCLQTLYVVYLWNKCIWTSTLASSSVSPSFISVYIFSSLLMISITAWEYNLAFVCH